MFYDFVNMGMMQEDSGRGSRGRSVLRSAQ